MDKVNQSSQPSGIGPGLFCTGAFGFGVAAQQCAFIHHNWNGLTICQLLSRVVIAMGGIGLGVGAIVLHVKTNLAPNTDLNSRAVSKP